MSQAIVARWRDWSGHGIEHLVPRTESNRIVAEGVVLTAVEEDASGQVRKNDDGSVLIRWWLRDEAGQFQPWMVNLFRPMRETVAS
jgi:hypothetical protein